MAQRKLQEKLETWTVVTLIAVLVWLYAEATVLQPHSATVQVQFSDPTRSFAIAPLGNVQINVNYNASSSQHQQFLAKTQLPLQIEIDTSEVDSVGTVTLLMKEELLRAGLGDLGIADFKVEPTTRNVSLRKLKSMTLPVVVKAEKGVTLNPQAAATAVPSEITIQAPVDLIDKLAGQVVHAVLSESLIGTNTGREDSADNVPLDFPATLDEAFALNSPWVKVDTRDAQVFYTLADNDAELVIDRVTLVVTLTAAQQNQYVVQLPSNEQWLFDVKLRGPAHIIQAIQEGDNRYPLVAELRMSDLDLTRVGATTSVVPIIRGAPGIITDPDPLNGVTVTVHPRPATP